MTTRKPIKDKITKSRHNFFVCVFETFNKLFIIYICDFKIYKFFKKRHCFPKQMEKIYKIRTDIKLISHSLA